MAMCSLFILPFCVNLIYIMAPNSVIGLRMLQGYLAIYLLFILLIDDFNRIVIEWEILSQWAISIVLILSLFQFAIVTNKVYLAFEIDKSNIKSYTNRVLMKIEDENFMIYQKMYILLVILMRLPILLKNIRQLMS